MYGIRLGSPECPLFYEERGEQTSAFSFAEARFIINSLLDKKARNNGVGKYLSDELRIKGECRYDFSRTFESLAFYCKNTQDGKYAIILFGAYPHELLEKLNWREQRERSIALTRNIRAQRRQLRTRGFYANTAKRKPLRALADANGNLKQHFQNSKITCSDAIVVISRATRFDQKWVKTRLVRSLDERAVASLRLKGGFVFRVDLVCGWRGLLDLTTPVQIRTTNDNTHGAYRRLRNALRKHLNRQRKARLIAQEKYLEAKRLRKYMYRLSA